MCSPRFRAVIHHLSTIASKVTHCIFDLDGLLLDNEIIYTQAIQRVLDPYGKTYTFDIKVKNMGVDPDVMGKFMVKHYNLPITPEEYIKRQDENTLEMMKDCKLMPGAERLVRHLASHDIPIAVATGTPIDLFEYKTRPHKKLFQCFHHIVCASTDPEVKHGKPAPDVFLVTASRFPSKPKPECCLVFEDAPNGLQAARNAGMQVVMVPDERLPLSMSSIATQRLTSLLCFKPEDFGLPSFENDCE